MSHSSSYRRWLPLFLLGVGLIHGILYVFLVPPWQHNDEPNHFEYAWLIAHSNRLPKPDDFNQDLNRKVMQSMILHHFYNNQENVPDLSSPQPIRLTGFSQLTDPPLYYLIAALPLRILGAVAPHASIEIQLYAARFASLAFLLVSLLAAWGLATELFGTKSLLRWLVPFTLALWPGYIDLMTAVTDFAGAVAFFSVFLWFSVRLIRQGFSWLDGLGAVILAAACCLTLSSLIISIPLLLVALLLSLFRGRWRWVAWSMLLVGAIGFLVILISWGDADLWYRETWQTETTAQANQAAPLGNHVFQLVVSAKGPASRLYQLIPSAKAGILEGKTVTFGAWIWATRPIQINSPILKTGDGRREYSKLFDINEIPSFYAITATLTGDTNRAWLILSLPASIDEAGTNVYFDGVVLAEGAYDVTQAPKFNSVSGLKGVWAGESFLNLVRNPSAEVAGPRIRLWADEHYLFTNYGRDSMILYALRDWSGAGWYFRGTAANLFRTWWGRFGWNHVPLLGHKPYRGLLWVTLFGFIGVVIYLIKNRKRIHWDAWIWLGMASILVVALTISRGVFNLWYTPFIPSARYIFPVMAVTVMLISAGWLEILGILDRWFPAWIKGIIYFSFFIGLDVYALISLTSFYS